MNRRTLAARLAQMLAQTLTGWALLIHVMGGEVSVFTVAFAVTAFSLPLRHDGSLRDQAKNCFSASLVLASLIGLEFMMSLLGGGLATEALLLLTATVLFSLAGGLYWIRRDDDKHNGDADPGVTASA